MKNVLSIGGLGLLMTACSFHASVGTNNNRPPPPPPHHQPAPPPRPVVAQQVQQVSPGAAAKPVEPVNVQKIAAAQARGPKGCGFTEVAPGNWVKVDCHSYNIAGKAIDHLSARKAAVVSSKQVLVKPFSLQQLQALAGIRSVGGTTPQAAAAAGNVKAEPIPGSVDHRTSNLEGPIKDQGPVGSCTAYSLSAAIDNAAIRAGKMSGADRNLAASPNHVWIGYGIPEMGTAADSSLNRSIATLTVWPQNNTEACKIANSMYEQECGFETNVTPGTWKSDPVIVEKNKKSDATPSYKITGLEKLKTLPPNVEELTSTLASGASLWIAMKIDGAAWSNAKMKQGVIQDWTTPQGGHAVEMAGYRDTASGKQFLIHNSWGTSWGEQGYAWVSEAMVNKFMHYAYKVKIEGGTPTQPSQATDNDCGPDELVDLTSGLCALMCGANRANGGCSPQNNQQPTFPIPPIFSNIFGSALPHP